MDAKTDIRKLATDAQTASEFRERLDERGKPVEPDSHFFERLESWLAAYEPRALPGAQREMSELADAYTAVKGLNTEDASGGYLYGRHKNTWLAFWRTFDTAQLAMTKEPPKFKLPPTPAELKAQNVGPWQIAHAWGLVDDNGKPDLERVEQELAKPGAVLTPAYIAAREQQLLKEEGWTFEEPDNEAQVRQELQTVEAHLARLTAQAAQCQGERDRLRGLLLDNTGAHDTRAVAVR